MIRVCLSLALMVLTLWSHTAFAWVWTDSGALYGCSDSLSAPDPDTPTHSWTSIVSTGTRVTLHDDHVSAAIPIGFEFYFYGELYTDAYISSNGFIGFLPGTPDGCCEGMPIPTPDDFPWAPDGFIAVMWDDLYPPGAGGGVYYETVGAAGAQSFIVEFNAVPRCCGNSPYFDVTAQVEVIETTGEIYLHYLSDGNATEDDWWISTIGIENQTGTIGVEIYNSTTDVLAYENVTVYCAPQLTDVDGDGYSPPDGDCDETDPDVNPDGLDVCNDKDDDCDPDTPNGAVEPWYGDDCDGDDSDLCIEGTLMCSGGEQACSDNTSDSRELCNSTDDDCDGTTPDGFDETWWDTPCDGADVDLCTEGVNICTDGAPTCTDTTAHDPDVCNGSDDDCDASTDDGSAETWFGNDCDGSDEDLCLEGIFVCASGSQECDDTTGDNADVCNGIDDDCRPSTSDGSAESWFGGPCDGADSDECEEGARGCSGGLEVCTDITGDSVELCNGLDDDCNGSVPANEDDDDSDGFRVCDGDCDDGDSDFYPGAPEDNCADPNDYNCDGSIGFDDSDGDGFAACEECDDTDDSVNPDATEICDGKDTDCDGDLDDNERDDDGDGYRGCEGDCDDSDSEAHPGAQELCTGTDSDCDPSTPDGALEEWFGLACDGDDTDVCEEGQQECVEGAMFCTDISGHNSELCNGLDDDCDGLIPPDEQDADADGFMGCERDCDDSNDAVNPNATEVCNDIDDNCDDRIDEDDVCEGDGDGDADADGDGDSDGDADGDVDGDGDGVPPGPVETLGCECRVSPSLHRAPQPTVLRLISLVRL